MTDRPAGSVTIYGRLLAAVNGRLLLEQTGISIREAVGKPLRVTLEQVVPADGIAVRGVVDEELEVCVLLSSGTGSAETFLLLRGKVVEAGTRTSDDHETAVHWFTVEERGRTVEA